jgi:hypothetical protein
VNGLASEEEKIEFTIEITIPHLGIVIGKGNLKKIITTGSNVYARMGFEVDFSQNDLNKIRKYVINRQKEIIKSLRLIE